MIIVLDINSDSIVYLGIAKEGSATTFTGYKFFISDKNLLLKTDGTNPRFYLQGDNLFVEQPENKNYYIDGSGHLIEETTL